MAGMGFSSWRMSRNSPNRRAPGEAVEKVVPHRIGDEIGGQLGDAELEALLETDGPEDPGGIFHETQVVEQADAALFDIPLGPEEIQQGPELLGVELQRQGVDGEVPAIEVHLDGAVFHDGQRPRSLVIFGPGGGHVDFEAVGENDHRGFEFLEFPGPGPEPRRKLPGEDNGVPFNDDVDVQVLMFEQQVPDKPAHHVGAEG